MESTENITIGFNLSTSNDTTTNNSTENYPIGLLQDTELFIPTVTVYTAIFLFGVLGNCGIIYILYWSSQKSSVNHFLLSLSAADALFLLFCCPYEAYFKYTGWLPGFMCHIVPFVEMWTALSCVLNLVAVSLERYLIIVHPVRCKQLLSEFSVILLIIFVWITAAILAAPCFYVKGPEIHMGYTVCTTTKGRSVMKKYSIYRFLVMFAVPGLIILCCNCLSACALWKSTKDLRRLSVSSKTQSTDDFKEKKLEVPTVSSTFLNNSKPVHKAVNSRYQTMKMFAVVSLMFILAWGPNLIYYMVKWNFGLFLENYYYHSMMVGAYYLQSALNPIVYITMSQTIRSSAFICGRKCFKRFSSR